MSTHERELLEAGGLLPLCDARGRLERRSVGFARRPVHDGRLPGPWGRRKRWCYWCVTAEPWVLQVTLADIDYLSLATLVLLDVRDGSAWERAAIHSLGAQAPRLPDGVFGVSAYEAPAMSILASDGPEGASLEGRFLDQEGGEEVRFSIAIEPAEDSLNVLIPWSERRYQLTSKHVGRRAKGRVERGGEAIAIEGFAARDYGRGRWPAHTRWNWGACAGEAGGRRIGVQLGAQWTDGTGGTENGLFLDGRLHKLGGRLRFDRDPEHPLAPWRVHGEDGRVELTFTPICPRPVGPRPLPRLDLAFGHYRGRVRLDAETVEIPDLFGWAEEVRVVW